MRIESIQIRGFGCLVERRYEFPVGKAALVLEENERGKSTLAAAILAGLCDFPTRKAAGEIVKAKDIYQPWQADTYAIEMDIEAGGRRLRIQRDFARGSFVVRDRETNRDLAAEFESDLAACFLNLPRDDYLRVALVSGKEVHRFASSPRLQSRLTALAEGSEMDAGAEIAIAALENATYALDGKAIKPITAVTRISHDIEEKRHLMAALDARLDAAGKEAADLERLQDEEARLRERVAALDAEYQAARLQEERDQMKAAERTRAELAAARQAGPLLLGKLLAAAGGIAGVAAVMLAMLAKLSPAASAALAGLGILVAAGGLTLVARLRAGEPKAESRPETNGDVSAQRPAPEVEEELRSARMRLDDVIVRLRDDERSVGVLIQAYRQEYPRLQEDVARLTSELRRASRFDSALASAADVLRELASSSRRRWASALNERASAILAHLNPDYDTPLFDDSLDLTVRHVADNRIIEKPDIDARLSMGAKDQIYLAVRLACCRELSDAGEPIPIILDDPLIASDDERFASGLRYLAETFALQEQVIILSCHRARHESLAGQEWFKRQVEIIEL